MKAVLFFVKCILCGITLLGAYGCLYAAQALAWPWPWKNIFTNFLNVFQTQFPTFIFGLINPGAPIQLRAASILWILCFFIAVLAIFRFQAKGNKSFVILVILLLTAYGLYIWAKGLDTHTVQLVGEYFLALFLFAFLGRFLQSKLSVSKRFDKA